MYGFGEDCDYDELKKAIFHCYDDNEETYGQCFRSYHKLPEESYVESGIKLKNLFTKWIQPAAVDLLQLLDDMPPELKVSVKERRPETLKEASEMGDNYIAARKASKDKRVCTNCGKAGHIARVCHVSEAKTDQKTAGEQKGVTKTKTVSGKSKNVTCFSCREIGHSCFSCGEIGHDASKCSQKLKTDRRFQIERLSFWSLKEGELPTLRRTQGNVRSQFFCGSR